MGRPPETPQKRETKTDIIMRNVETLGMVLQRDQAVSMERHDALVQVLQAVGKQSDNIGDLVQQVHEAHNQRWEALVQVLTSYNEQDERRWNVLVDAIASMDQRILATHDMLKQVIEGAAVKVAVEQDEPEPTLNRYGR